MNPLSQVPPPAEARQRWRLTYRRRQGAPELQQREQAEAWEAAFVSSGLPLVGLDLPVPRPRLVFAAPLAVGLVALQELMDFLLTERLTAFEVRSRLVPRLPVAHELVDLHDLWLGAPTLSGQVIAAVYRLAITAPEHHSGGDPLDREAVSAAARQLLAPASLIRTREKGGRSISYDLRPLLADIEVLPAGSNVRGTDDGGTAGVEIRVSVRFDPERGVGRLEEVLAALSEIIDTTLVGSAVTRERLILAGEG
ncbi:MAG: DUF2344 domain-containing protein [Chloroflexota bacterium]